ncbi:MAG TPA: autotransporter-associated beta strand repeat-containing protein, partial [Rariglobus sp.]|nr:autotransporter-associated beta strand repeat-containing protein [Rariglobus sp.]
AGTYDWNTNGSWSAAFPNATDAAANINIDIAGDQTINLNQSVTVGALTLNDSGASGDSLITIATGTAGGQLVFQTSSGNATLTQSNSAATAISSAVVFNSNTTISGSGITFSGPISGSGTVTKNNGANGLTLTGDNSAFTGAWVLSGNATTSRLFIGNDNNLGASGVGITFTNSNQISFTAAGVVLAATRTFTVNSGATAIFTATGTGDTVNSKITGAGAVTNLSNGTATLFLGNASSDFTGQLNLTGSSIVSIGTIANAGVASAAGAGSIINFGNNSGGGGSLVYTGSAASSDRALQIANTASTTNAKLINNGTGALTMTSTANLLTSTDPTLNTLVSNLFLGGTNTGANSFAQTINASVGSGLVNFTKQDAGTWRLANTASTYTGVTSIAASGGVLEVVKLADGGSNSSIGAATNVATNLLIGNAGTLRYVGAGDSTNRLFTVNGTANLQGATLESSGAGAVSFTNTGSVAWGTTNQTRTLYLGGTNTGANTLASLISNNGSSAVSVTKQDAGRWVLTNANGYTGATTINGGTLALGINNAIGSGSAIALTGGTFDLQGFSTTAASLGFANGTTLKFNLGAPGNVTALLALTGNFDKSGSGVFTLDFSGSGQAGTYNLVSFAGTTFASASEFSVVNLGSGLSGVLTLNGSSLSLAVSAVPEPSTYALMAGAFALAGATLHNRKRRG